jgi:dCMP deaminase
MIQLILGYVPVIHAGYLDFFSNYSGCWLGLIGPDLYSDVPEFEKLGREIRALKPEVASRMIRQEGIFRSIKVYKRKDLEVLDNIDQIVMPDEDVSRYVASKYLQGRKIEFKSVFLRFDMQATFSKRPPEPDRTVDITELDREMLGLAFTESQRSPDWWRQVGAVAVKDSQVLLKAHNRHMPSEHSLYALGDPRNNFKPAESTEMSCAHHAERSIIASAAGEGIALAGAYLYLTTFPCSACAYSIIEARISRVYYSGGYSSLEAAESCKARGVELVYVSV